MTETPEPPPEALLIEQNRKTRTRMSIRRAAEYTAMSEGRWRQIAKGYVAAARGMKVPAIAPETTLARMALTTETTAEELEAAGRPDAAELVRRYWSDANTSFLANAAADVTLADASDWEIVQELEKRLKEGARARDLQAARTEGEGHGNPAATSQAEVSSADVHHLPVREPVSEPEAMVAHETEGGLEEIEREQEETMEDP